MSEDEFVEVRKKVHVRDFLKKHAIEYLNAVRQLKRLEEQYKLDKARLQTIMNDAKNEISRVKLTPQIIEQLKKDENAYNTIREAFPELLEDE